MLPYGLAWLDVFHGKLHDKGCLHRRLHLRDCCIYQWFLRYLIPLDEHVYGTQISGKIYEALLSLFVKGPNVDKDSTVSTLQSPMTRYVLSN